MNWEAIGAGFSADCLYTSMTVRCKVCYFTLVMFFGVFWSSQPQAQEQWPMHHIDRYSWNHNSLSPGDVNGDGFDDFAVVHEGERLYTFVLHPKTSGDVKSEWQKVIVGMGNNPEYSDFGDFDGDGNLDLVGVGGNGNGVKIFWGPDKSQVTNPSAWKDGGEMPQTVTRGHHLFVESYDINQDGALDIVVGGRINDGINGGMKWIEAPVNIAERRDYSNWIVHEIDMTQLSGHGFEFTDIDEDGDDDIALMNADWDTPESEEMLLWYENPGSGTALQKQQWPMHIIHTSSDYYSKGQVGVGDINGDGMVDLCIQTEFDMHYFEKTGVNTEKKFRGEKWDHARFYDIDGDGDMDIIGNAEEHYSGSNPDRQTIIGVAWFENQIAPTTGTVEASFGAPSWR